MKVYGICEDKCKTEVIPTSAVKALVIPFSWNNSNVKQTKQLKFSDLGIEFDTVPHIIVCPTDTDADINISCPDNSNKTASLVFRSITNKPFNYAEATVLFVCC